MNEFIVSARKYRPVTFDTVVGQLSITTTLKNSIKNNHLGQAYLFCGPRGVGKTTCARIFAKTINCLNLTDQVEACDQCESCRSFNESTSYNIHELDAASNNSVEDIRNLIDQVRIPPQIGSYSIYIIDEVHMLSTAAFNAFLKTLEEPPKHAIFILATTEKHKILPTILSRCQIFDFNRIKVEDAVDHLAHVAAKESVDAEPEALNVIALKADGAMRDALSIFDQVVSFCGNQVTYQGTIDNLNVLDYDYFFKLTDHFLHEDYVNALILFDEILDKGFDAHNFLSGLCEHFRDLLVCKDEATIQLLEVGAAIKDKYKEQATACSADFLYKALDIGSKFDINYKASKNKRLHVELALLQFCSILKKKIDESDESPEPDTSPKKKSTSVAEKKTTQEKKEEVAYQSSAISFKEMMQGSSKVAEPKQEQSPVQSSPQPTDQVAEVTGNDSFTKEQLSVAWNIYAEKVKSSSPRHFAIITNSEPNIESDSKISIELSSPSQEEAFNKELKNDLISFLKQQLNNASIEIVVNRSILPKNSNKPYSSKDKYEYLLLKNPNLSKLKDNFDLDIL